MAALTIADVASCLERPHKGRPTVPNNDVLRKVMGDRVESHSRFHENRSHGRKRTEDFGPPARVSHLYGLSSSKAEAPSAPFSKLFPTEVQPSAVRNFTESKKIRSSNQFDGADKDYNDRIVVPSGVDLQFPRLQRAAPHQSTTRRSEEVIRKSHHESPRPVALSVAVPSPQSTPPAQAVPVSGRISVPQYSSRTGARKKRIPIPCDEMQCPWTSSTPTEHKYVPQDPTCCVKPMVYA